MRPPYFFEKLPLPSNPLSQRQEGAIVNLVREIGKEKYLSFKEQCEIPMETSIPRLSKYQAHRLIQAIISDLEANRR